MRDFDGSPALYELLFEHTTDGVLLTSPGGRIVRANPAACRALDRTEEEIVRLRRDELLVPDAAAARFLEARARTGVAKGEVWLRRADGTPFPVEATCAVLDPERWACLIFRDVTERRRAERTLRESEHRLRLFVEHAPAAIAMVDREMRYLAVSRRWLSDYRLGGVEVLGRSHYDVFPEIPARWREIHQRCLAGAVEQADDDPFPRADGTLDWVRWEVRPWRDDDGAVGGIILFSEVVTARKQAELALRASEAQVREAQKLDSVGRLAGGIAHDFNNLCTVILACAEALRQDLDAGRPASADDVAEITGAGRRAAELTRQLLAFARRQVIAPVVLDLDAAVRSARTLLARLVGDDIRVVEDLAASPWPVRCDPMQLDQVLLNLVVNARDAMPRGGELSLRTRAVVLGAAEAKALDLAPGEHVRLTVRDTGHGMTADVKAHLFEPFFTTKAPGAGTGLGLATVYGIVRQSGGAVAVESAAGAGTAVHVYLPRADPAAAPPPASAGGVREPA